MPAKGRVKVLSVGAQGALRRSLRRALEGAGFQVIDAGPAAGDVPHLVRQAPGVILLHSTLAEAGEHEECRRLKSDPESFRIPLVCLAPEGADDSHRARWLEAGADAYLPHPAEAPILLATVHSLLRARRVEDERDRLLLTEKVVLRQPLDEAGRLSEQRFRAALQRVPVAVWNQDLSLRYTWAYNAVPGFGNADPVGKTDQESPAPEEIRPLVAVKRRVLATGKGARQEIAITVEGESRCYDVILEPLLDRAGNVAGLCGAAVDMTEHSRLEAKLRQAQKLESIGVLAGGVAHDFNNLLTGILGNASLVLDHIPPSHPARPELDAIMAGAEKAAQLTSQLLAYAGKGQFVLEEVDLSSLVADILSLIRSSIPRSVRLHLALKPNLPAVCGDGTQLQQLIMNLIINAGEAIGGQPGTIRINTGLQEISPYYIERNPMAADRDLAPGTYVYVEVRDTGCGMDEETKSRIFDPFFTTKFTGRGLGLAAVQGIVRGHRGVIELHSTPGRGTTFKVLFPAVATRDWRDRREVLEEDLRGAGTILVVDEDDLICRMARSVLERYGYSVLLAGNGQQAIDVFCRNAEQIAAVLLDTSLPELSGMPIFEGIRALRPDMPVLVSSGYPESDVMRHFPAVAAPLFIQKPFTPRRIVEMIKAVTSSVPT